MLPKLYHDIESKPPVVLLHGLAGAARFWEPQIEALLKAGLRPIALDLLGHGDRKPIHSLTLEAFVQDVDDAIRKMELDRPILVGHSMGAMIAEILMARSPSRYRGAVLCSYLPFASPDSESRASFLEDKLAPLAAGAAMSDLAEANFDESAGPEGAECPFRSLGVSMFATTPSSTYQAALQCFCSFEEAEARLENIELPVLCIAGEFDRIAPAESVEKMALKMPKGSFICLHGVGHFPSLESPIAFNRIMLAFLRRVLTIEGSDNRGVVVPPSEGARTQLG